MSAQSRSQPKPDGLRVPFDPDCLMFIVPLGVVAALGGIYGLWWVWGPAALLIAAILAFFRDPPRRVPAEPGAVVSPADGKVVAVEPNTNPLRGPVPGTRITIFLSVLNCHINRVPVAGRIERIIYERGLFLDARDPESSEKNESNQLNIKSGRHDVSVRQITGLIARRIVCRVREGSELARGERFGLIRFGSRTELYLPPEAEIKTQPGDIVKGGLTILARLPED